MLQKDVPGTTQYDFYVASFIDLSYRTGPAARAATAGPSGHRKASFPGPIKDVTTFEVDVL
jgi:hypothetical protein